jgi:hypothetical protein
MIKIMRNHRMGPVKPMAIKIEWVGDLGVIGFAYKREK